MNFWQQLPSPILAVAPMADVTDTAFRQLLATHSAHTRLDGSVGGPDVMWTEFVSADGLCKATPEGRAKLEADLLYTQLERPIVAQLFSSIPEHMEAAAALCLELGFDGVDINMGCPDRSIEKQGCGAAMIRSPQTAQEIIRAAKRGARSDSTEGIPVSVKTRLGYNADAVEEWIPVILAESPAALVVHARTRKEMSKVPARWERLRRVVELRDIHSPDTRVIGNGDVLSRPDALRKITMGGVDGAMVGRALFGNPWFFHPRRNLPLSLTALPTKGVERDTLVVHDTSEADIEYVSLEERLRVLVEHTHLFAQRLPHKNFAVMKKHFKAYVSGFPGAAELRRTLMEETNNPIEVEGTIDDFLRNKSKPINIPGVH